MMETIYKLDLLFFGMINYNKGVLKETLLLKAAIRSVTEKCYKNMLLRAFVRIKHV